MNRSAAARALVLATCIASTAACGDRGVPVAADAAIGATTDGATADAATADAATDAALGCPDPDPPVGARLACHMVQFLIDGGLAEDQLVVDALVLRPPDGEAMLEARGWVQQPDVDGSRIYELGSPVLHLDGQRAVFAADGSITLVSMASENGGFIEIVRLDPEGAVTQNSIEQIPV